MKTPTSRCTLLLFLAAGLAGGQLLSVTPISLTFNGQVGGSPISRSFTVTSTGGDAQVAVHPSQSWLTVTPAIATTPQQFTVTVNSTGLTPGTYQDTNFQVIGPNNNFVAPVSFTVGYISVTPQILSFAYTLGSGVNPSDETLGLSGPPSLTGQSASYTASQTTATGGNWLASPVPDSGDLTAAGQLSISTNLSVLQTLGVGTYQGTVTLTANGPSPAENIPVPLTVSPQPPVTVSPSSVNLNYQIGGLNNQGEQQAVTLATTNASSLTYAFGTPTVGNNPEGCEWIAVRPSSGTIPPDGSAQSTISYNCPAGLAAGTYSGSVPVTATGGTLSTSSIPVTLSVFSSPLLLVPNTPLSFTYELGRNPPTAQTITPQSSAVLPTASSGQMPIVVSATTASGGPWLIVTPSATSDTGSPISISVNPANLSLGTYIGTLTVSPAFGAAHGNGPQTIPVTLIVANDAAILAGGAYGAYTGPSPLPVPLTALSFAYQVGQAAPASQTVLLYSSTGAQLSYSVTSAETTCGDVTWLALGGSVSGVTTGYPNQFTVTAQNLSALPTGDCTGALTVNATNPVTGAAALGSPLTIPVTLYVSSNPLLVVNNPVLSFVLPVGGNSSTFVGAVSSTNPSANLGFTVSQATSSGGNWLTASSTGATGVVGQNIASVTANPGMLPAGTYNGTITITATGSGVADSPVNIPVTLQVSSGTFLFSTAGLSFAYARGSPPPLAQTVQVTSNGSAEFTFYAVANSGTAGRNWLAVTPTVGTTPGTLSISVNGEGLAPGAYTGTVTVTAPNVGNSPFNIQVSLSVSAETLSASPPPSAGLTFTQPAGGVPFTQAPAQTITISSTPGSVVFSAIAATANGGNWLAVTPSNGETMATVQVSVNAASLPVGTYTGTVTITAAGASGGTIIYPVTLNVLYPIQITAYPATLSFGAILNGTAPAAQTVQTSVGYINGTEPIGPLIFPVSLSATTSSGGNWLSVSPVTNAIPGTVSVSVNPAGLAVGTYIGSIAVSSPDLVGATPATVTVTLTVSAAVAPVITAVTNAASGSSSAVSPGEEAAIYGSNFGPATVISAAPAGGQYPTTLSDTQMLFDGTPAPIIAIVNGQINVMVPYAVSGQVTTAVQVNHLGIASTVSSYNVNPTVPGIYTLNQTGSGQGAILNQDLSINGANNAAAPGSVVAVYMTGEGITTPPGVTGQIAVTLDHPVLPVTATVNGIAAPVQYAGSAPGLVYGVMQVNVQIPANAPAGNLPLMITVGTMNTQPGVTVAVQ